jgi:DNA polymerase-1
MKNLMLFDVLSIAYRHYYRLERKPLLFNGQNTSAIHGFLSSALMLLREYHPTHVAMCMDSGRSFRREFYAAYKSSRGPKPPAMIWSEKVIEQLCKQLRFPTLKIKGAEADDIIGTLATAAPTPEFKVLIVSSDKDMGQLVRPGVALLQPNTDQGYVWMGVKEVLARWDIASTAQVVDVFALAGDAVDDIPGVPGFGYKTAAKWLKQYPDVFELYANRGSLPGHLGMKLEENRERLLISRFLAEIRRDLMDLLPPVEKLGWRPQTLSAMDVAALDEYGLKTVQQTLNKMVSPYGQRYVPG